MEVDNTFFFPWQVFDQLWYPLVNDVRDALFLTLILVLSLIIQADKL
jgi:hypothetical protein